MEFLYFKIIILSCFCWTITNGQNLWWESATMYQIYPRSFVDSDGDGIGDLPGITSKLGYLYEIGIDTIWLSPIFKSPQKDFGYDVSDFYAIHHEYGIMEDFENLVNEANKKKINVVLDIVPNHSSDECLWFQKSINGDPEYHDFYVWHNGSVHQNGTRIPPNNWRSVFGGSAWTWNEQRQQYYLHQFMAGQPELNYRNRRVINEMRQVLEFWLKKGVSGFRIDAANHLFEDSRFRDEPRTQWGSDPNAYDYLEHIYTKDLDEGYEIIYDWRDLLHKWTAEHKTNDKMLLVEAFTNITNTVRYYESKDGRMGAVPFNFALVFLNKAMKAEEIKTDIENWFKYMPKKHRATWITGSHDHSRVGTSFGVEFIPIMNTLLFLLPGISVSYYGEEIGMLDNKDFLVSDSRDPNRTPMQWDDSTSAGFSKNSTTWLPVHSNYKSINVKALKSADRSHLHHFQELASLRNHPTIIAGNITLKAPEEYTLVFTREYKNNPTFVVVINLNGTSKTVDLRIFDSLTNKRLFIVSSAAISSYRYGSTVDGSQLKIKGHEVIVLRATSSGHRFLFSIWVLFMSISGYYLS